MPFLEINPYSMNAQRSEYDAFYRGYLCGLLVAIPPAMFAAMLWLGTFVGWWWK